MNFPAENTEEAGEMRKYLVILICFTGLVFTSCFEEQRYRYTFIKIDNYSSQDLHIRFYPNYFSRGDVTWWYKNIDIKKINQSHLLLNRFEKNL